MWFEIAEEQHPEEPQVRLHFGKEAELEAASTHLGHQPVGRRHEGQRDGAAHGEVKMSLDPRGVVHDGVEIERRVHRAAEPSDEKQQHRTEDRLQPWGSPTAAPGSNRKGRCRHAVVLRLRAMRRW